MDFINRTIALAKKNVEEGGLPFACLVVKEGKIITEATNQVIQTRDPTAHAEIVAIRQAAPLLKAHSWTGCDFYVLPHPCPMCLAAMYYCSPEHVIFITTRADFSPYYVDKRKYCSVQTIFKEITKPWQKQHMPIFQHTDPRALEVYQLWQKLHDS